MVRLVSRRSLAEQRRGRPLAGTRYLCCARSPPLEIRLRGKVQQLCSLLPAQAEGFENEAFDKVSAALCKILASVLGNHRKGLLEVHKQRQLKSPDYTGSRYQY